jgi:hypothetical protein
MSPVPDPSRASPRYAACLLTAAVVAAAVISWQALTVRFTYGGAWTALFCTGDLIPPPPSLASEKLYTFSKTGGFDGQFYHYIAHDPFVERDSWRSIDAPRHRYRRILIPLAAYVLAGGRSEWVDPAYRFVVWAFFFLGAYWLARFAVVRGRSPAWGLAFAILPGPLVSMDRLVTDIGLAALCAGLVLLLATGRAGWRLYVLLVLAGLVRDTGLLLAAAVAIWFLTRKDWRRAALFSTAILPTLAWCLFVASRTPVFPGDGKLAWPLAGPLYLVLHPARYPLAPWLQSLVRGLDLLAVSGVTLAFVLGVWLVFRRPRTPARWTMLLFVVTAQLLWWWGDWLDAYNYTRILSPLLFLLALEWLESRWLPGLLPLLMVLPRLGVQLGSQTLGIAKGLVALLLG